MRKPGADIITIHIEATEDLPAAIRTIKACGVKAGVSIKPKTPVSAIVPYLDDLDLVLIMSVEPGFGGQSFIEGSTEKVAELRREIDRCGSDTVIEIDGGITLGNAGEQFTAGCDVLVAGNTIFGSDDPTQTIHDLLRPETGISIGAELPSERPDQYVTPDRAPPSCCTP